MSEMLSNFQNNALSHKPFQGMRKVYHVLAASFFPILYHYGPFQMTPEACRQILLLVLGISFVIAFGLDLFRLQDKSFNSRFMKYFSLIIRHTEENKFNGSTFLCFAFFWVIFFFSKPVAVAAMLFLSLGDAAAEIGGKNFGRFKIFHRSIEGTLSFFAVAFIIAFWVFEDWRVALIGAFAGALVELFSFEVDDNLTVPIGSALALSLALFLFHLGSPFTSF